MVESTESVETMTLEQLVPEVTARPQQTDVFDQCFEALWGDEAVDVVLLEAPTGVGKSIVGLALARYAALNGNAYMVTPQRILQNQLGVWDGLKVMKGRGSYACGMTGDSASTGPCIQNGGVREANQSVCGDDACQYFKALAEAKACRIVVHNYASLMAQSRIGRHFGPRSLIILDEGHTAVNWIRNFATIEFTRPQLAALTTKNPPDDPRWFMPWLRAVLAGMSEVPNDLPDALSQTMMRILTDRNVYGIVDAERYEDMKLQHHEECSELVPEDRPKFFTWMVNKMGEDGTAMVPWHTNFLAQSDYVKADTWKCIPIKVAPLAHMLFGLGNKIVIMSATLLDAKLVLMELGLSKKAHALIATDSAFNDENRPVHFKKIGSMSFRAQKRTLPKMIEEIVAIATHRHPDQAGIVHTVSHALAWKIAKGLREHPHMPAGRVVVQLPRGGDRDSIIKDFLAKRIGPNAILVGPGLLEGVDGEGDSLRWQVMAKAPWMHMKDPVVSHLTDHPNAAVRAWGNKWYLWKAVQSFVQGCGRVCRTPTDFGNTYVLDDSFERIIKSKYIPQYLRDAITVVR